jgi:hypothetical protein
VRPPARRAVRRRPGRARRGDARHPDHRDAGSTTSTRSSPATTGPGRPETRSRTCWSCSAPPTEPASRSRSACPETARSTRSASRASSSRSRSSHGRGRDRRARGAGQGLHRPRGARGGVGVEDPLRRRPRASSRAPAG